MFALKTFVIAIVITVMMQVKVGTSTIETHAQMWIQTSSVPQYVQKVSSGAVLAVRNGAKAATDFVSKTFGKDPTTQRAGRLQFDMQRSPQYKQAHPEQSEENAEQEQ